MVPSVGRGDSATSWQSHTDLARGVRARERRVARAASDDTRGLRRVRRGGSGALAWASILGSYSLFRQMAHVSAPCEPRGASARGVPGARHACSRCESTTGAGGRAGGARRCKCPKTKTSRRSCPGERHRAQTPSLRPGCSHRREPTTGREPHHFFTTKRGPSLLSFSTSISSSSAMIPRCKLPRRGTPASGALRVGSGPGLSAPAPQLWARCV